ncbi:hypothetical protein PPOP_2469 [Paenibacillus popilliae ATCC 14706]|uniref:Uncharacterized protein n=1 Tax=Paenibacillus popilliae ATCC 14706 TaxID=1212764 RepID=M9LBA9_PAEPP|nr:hypothetical protein PPOP_2469 [Paenibacillus popilliae ATCC 14706]
MRSNQKEVGGKSPCLRNTNFNKAAHLDEIAKQAKVRIAEGMPLLDSEVRGNVRVRAPRKPMN